MERGEKERKGQKKKGEEEDAWWGGNVSTHSLKPFHLLDCTKEKVGHDMWGQDTST